MYNITYIYRLSATVSRNNINGGDFLQKYVIFYIIF